MTKQIILTSMVLLCSVLFFEYSNIDILVQDIFYDHELKQWALDRDDRITKLIFYDGIKEVFYVFVFLILISLLFFRGQEGT